MEETKGNNETGDAKPVAIVGIYLTPLDVVMVKIKFSDNTFHNEELGLLEELSGGIYSHIPRDFKKWRFAPY
jgi:hypothetical protein